MEHIKETRPSRQSRAGAHMNSNTEAACTGPTQIQARCCPSIERGSKPSFLTQKLSPIDSHLQRKILFSPVESHWAHKPHLRGTPHTHSQPTQTNSMVFLEGVCFIILCLGILVPCRSFAYVLWFLSLCFHGISVCFRVCMCFLCFFLGPFPPSCLFCPILVVFVVACLFSNERERME